MIKLFSAWLVGLLIYTTLEWIIIFSQKSSWKQAHCSYLISIGTWSFIYSLLVLLMQRPYFSALCIIFLQIFLLMVNAEKVRTLREPFILQDFEYFYDMIKHPRLYIPFFGILKSCLLASATVIFFIAGFAFERSILDFVSIGFTFLLLLLSTLVILLCYKSLPKPVLNPIDDLNKHGQLGSFWLYFKSFNFHKSQKLNEKKYDFQMKEEPLPNLIVIQSESFFDPRPYLSEIDTDILKDFDTLKNEAIETGNLNVPVWGANTVRTECAFLTGISEADLGIHQFNPYRLLSKRKISNMISYLKSQGYTTIAIHPYPSSFYFRDKVFNNFGFDQFIDIKFFHDEQKSGPYIGDLAVSDMIQSVIKNNDNKPIFVFAITMENHGPLHLEDIEKEEASQFFTDFQYDQNLHDLYIYLRHLKNANLMQKRLRDMLKKSAKKTYLCWYGDHVPAMPNVYKQKGFPEPHTPFYIWSNNKQLKKPSRESMLSPQALSHHLLERSLEC